jgi:hypothetical protein
MVSKNKQVLNKETIHLERSYGIIKLIKKDFVSMKFFLFNNFTKKYFKHILQLCIN